MVVVVSCYAAHEVSEYLVDGTKLNLGRKMMILYINVELDVATIIKHELTWWCWC